MSLTPEGLQEMQRRLESEAGLPEGALSTAREIKEGAAPEPPTFPQVLRKHPAWTALQAQLVDETALLIGKLITMEPQVYKGQNGASIQSREDFTMAVEALRGEIRGMLRVLDAPAVAQRAIELRRI